ncbi:hypothetical protein psyc5s11_52850 [Clostridium gelidum]|uniref:YokE-like PH domain-containing protein n=1 Tax=Clostridium gelidum TaxID=704125 RepID=A0ABN6J635_9CLOT|nr:hypothetical protein [Clostridium gelidum]BCZ49218.1 hypothetical protein psyc5s11_52850 [Clostridium gelidum]
MNNNEFLSQSEIDEIEKIEVNNDMLERAKKRQTNTLWKMLMADLLKDLKEKLDANEEIEFYFVGRDYTSDSTRLVFAGFGSAIANPILGWSSNCILIRTNKRFLLAEVTGYLQYSNYFEIKQEVHLYKEKEYFYLTVEHMNGHKRTLQYGIKNFDIIFEYLKDSVNIILDKKLKSKSRLILKIISSIEIAFVIWILYLFISNWSNIVPGNR